MEKRAVLALALVVVMSLSIMVGCTNKDTDNKASSVPVLSAPKKAQSGQLTEVHEAVKEAYGDTYIPTMPIDEKMIKEIYGIDSAWIKEIIAEAPMISVHVDTFIGIEAEQGKAEDVENALKAYNKKQIEESHQYPMNMPRVKSASIKRVDDYVFFCILGDIEKITTPKTEEEQLQVAQEEVKKAEYAIDNVLKK